LFHAGSELEAKGELNLPGSRRAGDPAERVPIEGRIRVTQAHAVGQIVELRAELQHLTFMNAKVFLQRNIPVIAAGRGDHEWPGGAIGKISRQRKRSRVEPLVDRLRSIIGADTGRIGALVCEADVGAVLADAGVSGSARRRGTNCL